MDGRDSSDEKASYVTLSHCWGPLPRRTATTSKANLAERRESIGLDELPLTYRDAVEITRSLGIRYLWIDSLCIIQDQPDDWKTEVTLMGQVYAQSICTLIASSADSPDRDCRVKARKTYEPRNDTCPRKAEENNLPVNLRDGLDS